MIASFTRRHFLPVFLSFVAAVLAGCSRENGGGNELKVGMDMTYPPFEFKNENGEPDGVDVRLAEALAADLGRPLKLIPLPFESLIPELKSGKIDLAISAMTASEERRASIDFSDPYAWTSLALLVSGDSPVQSVNDLKAIPDLTVTAKLGTTGEVWARQNLPGAKIISLDDEGACVKEVAQGKAVAFLYDQLSIYGHHQRNKETTRAILQPFQEESWGIGIRKGNDELRGKVNTFLKKFREAGGMSKLGDQYLAEEKKLLEGLGIPFILR